MKFDIGCLGGGQLARMSIQAAQRMGLTCISLDPDDNSPASQLAPSISSPLNNEKWVAAIFEKCDHVTLENEFIPADVVRNAVKTSGSSNHKLIPNVETLATIQDKFLQKHALTQAGVPTPKAVAIENNPETAIQQIGFPMVLKARFGGYDGKGTRYAKDHNELQTFQDLWGKGGWMAESFVKFKRELAVMVYISEWGAGAFPTMETVQKNHICDLVYPADVDATAIAVAAVEAIGGNGLFGVELFETEDSEFLVNEIAPRPHNTGHYTLDYGSISQFEMHVRLVMGFPLVHPSGYRPVCMANLVGEREGPFNLQAATNAALESPNPNAQGQMPNAQNEIHLHWYGKKEMRPGRKMGHINAVGNSSEPLESLIHRAKAARERFFHAL